MCDRCATPQLTRLRMPDAKPRIYILCPVRKALPETVDAIATYVAQKEKEGHEVYWPKRDTPQDGDPIGLRICRDNGSAIYHADEIHIFWDRESAGSLFDLGMLFMLKEIMGEKKKVVLVNADQVPPVASGKDFVNVLYALATSEETTLRLITEIKNASP